MKWRFVVAALLPLLTGCGVDRGPRTAVQHGAMQMEPQNLSQETFALGTAVTSEGAVPQDAIVETVARGGEVYLSVNVAGASTEQVVQVAWVDPLGHVLRRDAQLVDRGSRYVAFASGPTRSWRSGAHRAVVVIDGRSVNEKTFDVM